MLPQEPAALPLQGEKDDSARDSPAEDGLADAAGGCRLVQDVESGQVMPSNKASQSHINGVNGAFAGQAAGEFGPSLVAISNIAGLPNDVDGLPARTGSFKPGRTSSFQGRQRGPSSAPVASHAFKLAPQHDEHQEVAASCIFTPKQTYDHIVATGVAKTQLTLAKQVTQGVMAGFYISFSFMLCMTVGGQIETIQHEHPGIYNLILGSVGFPLGLTVIMVVGADLFTSSCMYMMTAWLEGRVATYYVIKNWFVSWWSNLAGCIIMAQLVVWAGLFAGEKSKFPIYLAHKKTGATFGATLVKGIICNWLVNLAVWMANSARDVTGKAVGVYLPVSAFVTLGTEHVIANQFELTLAKMLGSGIPLRTIIGSNFVPATIGNIIGGAFFVGTLYAGTYGTLYDRIWLRTTQLYIWIVPKRTRKRIGAAYDVVYDKFYNMVDWEAITAPPAPLPPLPGAAQPSSALAPAGPAKSISRALSSALADTPKRLATAAVAATRNPPMTPFERKRTSAGLGSDVV
ncbi:hypothetical protein PLESTB_001455900 [Pleodorina starrii]|uniref:Formate nitrite transporter n=1 Tax=Pleodorina starrii TaxID=330485 RepID=A0A9W6BWP9_9CHLO|nr:hypothetical protein PLESTM_002043000 [Pleodorina starrii]GLC59170.1 hypothetical protein PLESTB_001455900 [Pleodorina starrii]GLC65019.1 hypothetical protein PLESTF_000236700 [Pleodorina starrii]